MIKHDFRPCLPEELYRKIKATSQSDLRNFKAAPSPLHYWQTLNSQAAQLKSNAMLLGSLFHMRADPSSGYKEKHVRQPNGLRKGTIAYRVFLEENPGKNPVLGSMWDQIEAMYENLMSHQAAEKLLTGGVSEESWFYDYGEFSQPLKGRLDYRQPKYKVILNYHAHRTWV